MKLWVWQMEMKTEYIITAHSRRGCLTAVLLLFFMHTWGQAIDWDVHYREGDNLEFVFIDDFKFAGELDNGIIADLSGAKTTASGILCLKLDGSDSIAAWDEAGKTTYKVSDDTIFLTGHEDKLCAIHYDEPEVWLRRGLRKGEVLEGLF